MNDITIREIIDLATQDISDPDAEIKKIYEWHSERKLMVIKGTVSIAVSLIITLAISYYKSEIRVDQWLMLFPFLFSLLSMTYGAYELNKLRRLGRKYVAAITLLNRIKQLRPFFNRYRNLNSSQ